jgi:hypothetical protein
MIKTRQKSDLSKSRLILPVVLRIAFSLFLWTLGATSITLADPGPNAGSNAWPPDQIRSIRSACYHRQRTPCSRISNIPSLASRL